ncbi:MAG TPA: hypothetical protein VNT56_11975, partial [Acidimicrobiales bacterium]|nr:hypothetical protein [Acidimicrobiales bacterium]
MISPASLPPRIDDLPEVATAAETFVALHAEAGAAWQQVRDLEDDRRHALEADTNAYAAAIRQGKPDPGQKNVTKLDAELLKARRRSEALKVAVEDAEEELRSAVASHRTEWA